MKKITGIEVIIVICAVLGGTTGICQTKEAEQKQIVPKKVEVDANYDGKIDRVEYYDENGQVIKMTADSDNDGIFEETVIYKAGKPIRSERDTNKDGKGDVWLEF